jgi:dodecin
MAKAKSSKARSGDSVYRITELVGTSTVSWEDAAKRAVETAASSLRDLRVADIIKLDVKVEDGNVLAYRARVALSFKYEA